MLMSVLRLFALVVMCANTAQAQVRSYVFGNSLIHHQSDSDETTVPHWVAYFARTAGQDYSADGQWGFLQNFAANLPPQPVWSFKEVKSAWDADRVPFADAKINTIMMNPANFIQYQPPDIFYDGDNPNAVTPVSATVDLMTGSLRRQPRQSSYCTKDGRIWPRSRKGSHPRRDI